MRSRRSLVIRRTMLRRGLVACALAAVVAAAGSHGGALAQQPATSPPASPTPAAGLPAAPQDEPQLPRFRGGTNLVRLDAYVSANGAAVTDLTADEFEVFEDDKPQKVEGFELVRARGAGASTDTVSSPNPNSTREQREAAQDPAARVFVIFVDHWHMGLGGSARSSEPIAAFLDKVVGPGDLVGVMTPDISAENITLTRRGAGIDRMLRDAWTFGQRDRLNTLDPHEQEIQACYPDEGSTSGIAQEMIERRREQKTLRALDGMIRYLDGLREERKFVVLLSEGWILFRRNDQLARPLGGVAPGGPQPVGVGGDGRVTTQSDPRTGGAGGMDACERERVMLSYIDHELEVRQLAQRANRANVSFYTVDPRGLTVFDESLGARRPRSLEDDRQRLGARQDGLKTLAEQTDGAWVLNTNDTAGGLARILADTSSYYLLSY
jgi:VWFA-related protein